MAGQLWHCVLVFLCSVPFCDGGIAVAEGQCQGDCLKDVQASSMLMKAKHLAREEEHLDEDLETDQQAEASPGLVPTKKMVYNGVCPMHRPWAYRPGKLDYCCASQDDKSTAGRNGLADKDKRGWNCKHNKYYRCKSSPCMDFSEGPGLQYEGSCPESHPYAYRPTMNLDYCCKNADDNGGNTGINSNPDKQARASSCKWNQFTRCSSPPCKDFGEAVQDAGSAAAEWYFLDHFPGTPAKCGAPGYIQCASDDGLSCSWGNYGGVLAAYERIKGVLENKTVQVACPGWPTKDGTDACAALGCYGNDTGTAAPAPATPGKCAPLALPGGYQAEESCNALSPGQSCEVGCPAGMQGFPMRYTCYQALAAAGKPPAAPRKPACYTATNFLFPQAGNVHLQWRDHVGCLKCSSWKKCTLTEDYVAGDARCTKFYFAKVESESFYRFKTGGQCLQLSGWIDIPKIGLWGCGGSNVQKWLPEPSAEWPGTYQFCASDYWRGKVCVGAAGLPSRFAGIMPDATLVQPAIQAMGSGDNATFLKQAYALQTCKAKIESGLPDEFWQYLRGQEPGLAQALLSSFPVQPGQLKMFSEIRDSVGHNEFESLGMQSFAVALAYVNRYKQDLDLNVQPPHPIYERNNNGFTDDNKDKVKEELETGVRFHNPSCGGVDNWNFSWPREPSPSIRQWVEYWKQSVAERGSSLWLNPLQEVPWHFAVYLWPSPLEECEWVRKVVIDKESFEGAWYKYTRGYYDNICAGSGPYGDSLMGIAEYGGICDRMAELEWRKSSCMGMPSQQKSEPGHWAGFKFGANTGKFVQLNAITDVSNIFTLEWTPVVHQWVTLEWVRGGNTAFPNETTSCLSCPHWRTCTAKPLDSGECTKFRVDMASKRLRSSSGQCMDMHWGPTAGMWSCGSGSNGNQDITQSEEGHFVISSNRGTIKIRVNKLPMDVVTPKCLKCTKSRKLCEFALHNSSECSQFSYLEGGSGWKSLSTGQCIDQYSGSKPGLWSCNGGSNQKLTANADGTQYIKSGRGTLTFKTFSVDQDMSEFGRCLRCAHSWKDCEFAAADSGLCSEFRYDMVTKQLRMSWGNQCVYMKGPQKAALWSCHKEGSVHSNRVAEIEGEMLVIRTSGMKMQLIVPGNGSLPETATRWSANFYHTVDCQKGNCHYPSALTLNSAEMFDWRHGEAAIAATEAYNDYEKNGLWPTAHDEARLAASFVYALRAKAIASDSELEPVVAWALRRNPGLYDAWELAAEFPAGGPLNSTEQPVREELASRRWYNKLKLLSVSREVTQSAQQAAERFAKEHLLPSVNKKWLQLPQLHQVLIGKICGALSDDTLAELGEASAQCVLVRRLAEGAGWEEMKEDTLEADATGSGNLPSDKFMLAWEVMTRLAMVQGQHNQTGNLIDAIEYLLEHLTVGYINERVEAFFSEHKRVVLRGPYAHMLQLAAKLMTVERRYQILNSTKTILEKPWESTDRLLASPEELQEKFLNWVAYEHGDRSDVKESAAVTDMVDGFLPTDGPSPDVVKELTLDRDEELENGAGWEHSTWSDEGEDAAERYDVVKLLERLLDLTTPAGVEGDEDTATQLLEEIAERSAAQARALRGMTDQATPTEVMQMCVDDMFAVQ